MTIIFNYLLEDLGINSSLSDAGKLFNFNTDFTIHHMIQSVFREFMVKNTLKIDSKFAIKINSIIFRCDKNKMYNLSVRTIHDKTERA